MRVRSLTWCLATTGLLALLVGPTTAQSQQNGNKKADKTDNGASAVETLPPPVNEPQGRFMQPPPKQDPPSEKRLLVQIKDSKKFGKMKDKHNDKFDQVHDFPDLGVKALKIKKNDKAFLQELEDAATVHTDNLYEQLTMSYNATSPADIPTEQPPSGPSTETTPATDAAPTNRHLRRELSLFLQSWYISKIKADKVSLKAVNRDRILVCLIDSGVQKDHMQFWDTQQYFSGSNNWATDSCGSGTQVTGVAAAGGGFGVAKGVFLYHVNVYQSGNCQWSFGSDLIRAAETCRQAAVAKNARLVINYNAVSRTYSAFEDWYFRDLYTNKNVLIVAPAGSNADGTSVWYPASYSSVISVAAVDWFNQAASFSPRNDQIDIAAPGVGLYTTTPYHWYATVSGAGIAAPLISASAAVVWSYNPLLTSAQVRNALLSTASDLGVAGWDSTFGAGLVNVCNAAKRAGFDPYFWVYC